MSAFLFRCGDLTSPARSMTVPDFRMQYQISAFAVNLTVALGTGDHNAAFSAGDPAHCVAVRAGEIFVLLIPQSG